MGVWKSLGRFALKVMGWKLVGEIPEGVDKCVIPVAPHTCIEDFILGRLAYCSVDKPVKFLIKKEFFDNPILRPLLKKLVHHWKKGFYYIAEKAHVPIVLGFIDFKKKELGFGPMFYPSGNFDEDWKIMEEFYRGITAKYPDRYNLSN